MSVSLSTWEPPLVPEVDVCEQSKQLGQPELQPPLGEIPEQPEDEDEEHDLE